MKNANQIRQLLESIEWIHVAFHEDDFFCPSCKRSKEYGHYKDCQLKQALALLPCGTCNGTVKKPDGYLNWHRGVLIEDEKLGLGLITRTRGQKQQLYQVYVNSFPTCPDCQPKPKQEESSPSTMWEHLH